MTRVRFGPGPFGPGGPHVGMGFIRGGPGGPGPIGLFLAFVVIVAAIVLAAALIRRERQHRHGGPDGASGGPGTFEALRILNERFARGDIDADDFKVRRDLLQGPA
jgi:putative membrane protein